MGNENAYTYSVWVPGNPIPTMEEGISPDVTEGQLVKNYPLWQAWRLLTDNPEVSQVRWRIGEVDHLLARNTPTVV